MPPHRMLSWLAALALAPLGAALPIAAHGALPPDASPAPLPQLETGNDGYLAWVNMGRMPQDSEIREAAGKYQTVIFGAFMLEAAKKLRELDPHVRILAYLDLASVREYDGSKAVSAGVSYTAARDNGWLAYDNAGTPITWRPYPGHYQAAVWNTDYQRAWVQRALEVAAEGPWDGIFADNDMITMAYYTDALVMGSDSREASDALVVLGLDALIREAGTQLNAQGKLLVPNIGDGRRRPATYANHAAFGGGLDEMYMSWAQDGVPTVWDWGQGGWATQVENTGLPSRTVAITQSRRGDWRTETYGYASFLLAAQPGDAWTANDGSDLPSLPPETGLSLGRPTSDAELQGTVRIRTFESGWVAVNPTRETHSVKVPDGAHRADGSPVNDSIALEPLTAVILSVS